MFGRILNKIIDILIIVFAIVVIFGIIQDIVFKFKIKDVEKCISINDTLYCEVEK